MLCFVNQKKHTNGDLTIFILHSLLKDFKKDFAHSRKAIRKLNRKNLMI